jgi:hypothetical protein
MIAVSSASFSLANTASASTVSNYKVQNVPYSTQAPFGEWNDPRQQDGCEETSIVMAWMWANDISFTPDEIRMYITQMSDYENHFYGYYRDSSATDTANLMTAYFGHLNVRVNYNISVKDIKSALDNNELVITPINPRVISTTQYNRYTTNHTVVVVGYDDADGTMIIHDPLRGTGYTKIPQANFEAALGDYHSGQTHRADQYRTKSMIVVGKVN